MAPRLDRSRSDQAGRQSSEAPFPRQHLAAGQARGPRLLLAVRQAGHGQLEPLLQLQQRVAPPPRWSRLRRLDAPAIPARAGAKLAWECPRCAHAPADRALGATPANTARKPSISRSQSRS